MLIMLHCCRRRGTTPKPIRRHTYYPTAAPSPYYTLATLLVPSHPPKKCALLIYTEKWKMGENKTRKQRNIQRKVMGVPNVNWNPKAAQLNNQIFVLLFQYFDEMKEKASAIYPLRFGTWRSCGSSRIVCVINHLMTAVPLWRRWLIR